ncbi:hypothetical protein GYMLUDRAFT_237043 [Collybiopsis luxurians FD-317 M1]|nr:hypothetical protein GYMLUDRAFT_237043 [Collybiopsis luxurians FD-317 M1]
MTPAQELPSELLIEIFHFVNDPPSVIVLSSVCSHWRAILIETPSLWKTIFLPELSMEKLQIHLQRSRSCPLIIRISASYVFNDYLLTLLAEHSERWEEVVISMPASLYTSLSSVRGRIPLLKRLTFIALDSVQPVHFKGIEIAPALLCVPYPDISFPELRKLEMHTREIPLPNFMLSRAPNLTTLRVSILPLPEVPASSSEVTLPHLRHLILDSSGFPTNLKLRVPRLSALELNDGDPKRDMIALRDLIVRSGCKLGTFKLTIYTDLAPGMALLLKAMPSLRHLHIAVYSPKEAPFHLITPVSQVFPKLRTFRLSATYWNAPDAPAALSELIAFAQSNNKLKVSLRHH